MADLMNQTNEILNKKKVMDTKNTEGNLVKEEVKEPPSLEDQTKTAIEQGIYSPDLRNKFIAEITGNMLIGIGFKKNGEIFGNIKIVNGGKIKAEQIAEDKKLIINEKIEFYKQVRANEDDKAASQILGSLENMLGYIPRIASHTEHEWIWSEHEDSQINLKGEICENIVNGDGIKILATTEKIKI